jgi:hypothetical protein
MPVQDCRSRVFEPVFVLLYTKRWLCTERSEIWSLLLHFSIDTGCEAEDDHEQTGNRCYNKSDESQHEQSPQDVDNQIHRVPPE